MSKDINDYDKETILSEIHTEHSRSHKILSFAGCLTSVIIYLTVVNLSKNYSIYSDRTLLHRQLAASIILMQSLVVCWIVFSNLTTEHHHACYIMAMLLHYSMSSMFCWTLVEVINLSAKLFWVFHVHSCYNIYLTFGWGFPLIIVIADTAMYGERFTSKRLCWIDRSVFRSTVIPIISIVVVMNATCIGFIIFVIKTSSHLREHLFFTKKFMEASVFLLPALALTLILSVLATSFDTGFLYLYFTFAFIVCCSLLCALLFAFHSRIIKDSNVAFYYVLVSSYRTPHIDVDIQQQPTEQQEELQLPALDTIQNTISETISTPIEEVEKITESL